MAAGPHDADSGHSARSAESRDHAGIVGRRVAAVRANAPPENFPAVANHADFRADHVACSCRTNQPQSDPSTAVADVIEQEPRRSVVVADQDVRVTVVVDIAERGPAAHVGQLEYGAGAFRDVLEPAFAGVAEQLFALT